MSDDEAVVLVLSTITALFCWGFWYFVVIGARRPGQAWGPLRLVPLVCPACCFLLLGWFADAGVRSSFTYRFMYTMLGAAWVGAMARLLELFDISMRDDAVGRGNASAVAVWRGAVVALWLAYTGGNFGDGPGWWVVVFCTAVTTSLLAAMWLGVELISGLSERVTVDRDLASGIRFGALLAAAGLVLGRGAAGDWVSKSAAVSDILAVGWPALAAGGLEAVLSLVVPRASRPDAVRSLLYGFVPAAAYLIAAGAWVVSLGAWE